MNNLTGEKIDRLKIEEVVVQKPYSKKSYRCVCDCGNSVIRLHSTLSRKGNHSCGRCTYYKNLIPGNIELCSKAGKHRKDSFVNGSNVQMTLRDGTIKTNTSGIQGVSWSRTANRWHVYVGYQNYRANLGFYEDLEDAKKVRELAEEAIKDNRFEDFFYNLRGFRLEDKLQKQFKKR